MPQHVGQRLLEDPVTLPGDRPRHSLQRPGDLRVDLRPGSPRRLQQPVGVHERRPTAHRPLRLPQHAQHPLQVLQRGPAGLLDGTQGALGEVRVTRRAGRTRLHHRDRQRVTDGVVQLPRDTRAFEQLLGALLQGGEALRARGAEQLTGQQRGQLAEADDGGVQSDQGEGRQQGIPPVRRGFLEDRYVVGHAPACDLDQLEREDRQPDAGERGHPAQSHPGLQPHQGATPVPPTRRRRNGDPRVLLARRQQQLCLHTLTDPHGRDQRDRNQRERGCVRSRRADEDPHAGDQHRHPEVQHTRVGRPPEQRAQEAGHSDIVTAGTDNRPPPGGGDDLHRRGRPQPP